MNRKKDRLSLMIVSRRPPLNWIHAKWQGGKTVVSSRFLLVDVSSHRNEMFLRRCDEKWIIIFKYEKYLCYCYVHIHRKSDPLIWKKWNFYSSMVSLVLISGQKITFLLIFLSNHFTISLISSWNYTNFFECQIFC